MENIEASLVRACLSVPVYLAMCQLEQLRLTTYFDVWWADIKNHASVKALFVDICVGNCGHFDETQWISTKMSNYGQIMKPYVK